LIALVEPLPVALHELIKFMEVDIGQQRRDDATLRRSTECLTHMPVFEIARFQHTTNETDEFVIIDPLCEQLEQYLMVDVVEEPRYIDLDQPLDAGPDAANGVQCGVTGAPRSESMTMFREHRLINPFKDASDHLLHQAVVDRWDTKRTQFAVGLGNVDPAHGVWVVGSAKHLRHQPVKPLRRKAVEGLTIDARRQRTLITGNPFICLLPKEVALHEVSVVRTFGTTRGVD
jgi:hypothetical protein